MTRMRVKILGNICETGWTNSQEFKNEGYKIIYAGGNKHESEVGLLLDEKNFKAFKGWWAFSDRVLLARLSGTPFDIAIIVLYAPTRVAPEEEVKKFYEELEQARAQCNSQEMVIIMGDRNATVGDEKDSNIVGKHGLGTRNER